MALDAVDLKQAGAARTGFGQVLRFEIVGRKADPNRANHPPALSTLQAGRQGPTQLGKHTVDHGDIDRLLGLRLPASGR
jgi:hypothetical protein